jgi:AraC-like DNA-binding protein
LPRAEVAPDPALGAWVNCLWRAERDFAPGESFELLPDGYVELVFSLGAPLCVRCDGEKGAPKPLPRAFVVGLLRRPLYLHAEGMVRVVAARFHAWGFLPLFGEGPEPPSFAGVLERADGEAGLDAALTRLHDLLRERARAAGEPAGVRPGVARALSAEDPARTVGAMAEAGRVSPRQLERDVRRAAGVAPKLLTRTVRFQRVRDRLWHEPGVSLATLAAECGYADQAHLSREFKEFSGRTPARFAAEAAATQKLLASGRSVAFLQDG